jgi:hypothetical protein
MHGYSSSEESEDPKRPRPQPAQSNNQDKNAKKKKKRLPPQQSINRIWKKFSNRKFHKALAVLPFDPVPPSASADRPTELLWDGYERAAEECRRKVEKIVKECKRVNMRYRDPGFDLVGSHGTDGFGSIADDIFRIGTSNMKRATVSTAWGHVNSS